MDERTMRRYSFNGVGVDFKKLETKDVEVFMLSL